AASIGASFPVPASPGMIEAADVARHGQRDPIGPDIAGAAAPNHYSIVFRFVDAPNKRAVPLDRRPGDLVSRGGAIGCRGATLPSRSRPCHRAGRLAEPFAGTGYSRRQGREPGSG